MAVQNGILVTESGDTLLPFGSDIADGIETTANASKAYSVGQLVYVVLSKQLYKVIAAISVGDSFSSSNVEPTTISEMLANAGGGGISSNVITDIQVVNSLPVDSQDHPNTLYLIK